MLENECANTCVCLRMLETYRFESGDEIVGVETRLERVAVHRCCVVADQVVADVNHWLPGESLFVLEITRHLVENLAIRLWNTERVREQSFIEDAQIFEQCFEQHLTANEVGVADDPQAAATFFQANQ
ncbi:hypothetical protein D3C73_1313840 [compost metagenome]